MDSKTYNELEEEIEYLLQKKVDYGWTQKDADRYNYLKDILDKDSQKYT